MSNETAGWHGESPHLQCGEDVNFIVEYPLDLVAHEGDLLADDTERVEDQRQAYS